MKNLKLILLSLVLIPCALFSQKTVLSNGDSLIAYTHSQNDFIIKSLKQLKYYKIADSISSQQITDIKKAIEKFKLNEFRDSIIISNYKLIERNSNTAFALKQRECEKLEENLKIANKEIKKQKAIKWIAIIGGSALSGYLAFKAF